MTQAAVELQEEEVQWERAVSKQPRGMWTRFDLLKKQEFYGLISGTFPHKLSLEVSEQHTSLLPLTLHL